MSDVEVKIARAYNLKDAWILLQRLILSYGKKSNLTGAYRTTDIFVRCDSCVDDGLDKIIEASRAEPCEPMMTMVGNRDAIVDKSIIKLRNSFVRMEQDGNANFSVSRTLYKKFSCTVVVSHGDVTITLVSGIQRASVGSAMMLRALTEVITHVVPDIYSMNVKVNLMITDLFEDDDGAAMWASLGCCKDMIQATEHELTRGLR